MSSYAGGILEDVSESVVAVIIPEGAHHLDLMFSHPDDPPSLKEARKFELQHVEGWISKYRQRNKLDSRKTVES